MLLGADNFGWETNEEFIAWMVARHQKKTVQGKGIYDNVSGSGPKKEKQSDEPETAICPVHGVEETFLQVQVHRGP